MRRLTLLALLLCGPPVAAQTTDVPPDLARYVAAADGAFSWELADTSTTAAGTVYTLDLVSQKWQGVVWDHKLQVIVPQGTAPKATMLLYNTGGGPNPRDAAAGLAIAQKVGSPIAYLFGVPKQPLFGGKREDALIAETFVKYLETKDSSWPLLFPMAKSVVKAMDAVQAFAKQELKADVKSFVVSGASKRGWTSWLTAASGDPRVKAVAPLVIDNLNIPRQMAGQLDAFGGRYSVQIRDYEARGLLPLPDTADARRLWRMVDPWTYRAKLTLPKLLVHGTNDPYWASDATNVYWDDLTGPKYLCYVPNAGHDLRPMPDPADPKTKELFPTQAINTLAAFARSQIDDRPLPKLTWRHGDHAGVPSLSVISDVPPKAVKLWAAEADTRDFRRAKWSPAAGERTAANNLTVAVPPPTSGYKAVLAEAEYETDGKPFTLTTQVRILEPKK